MRKRILIINENVDEAEKIKERLSYVQYVPNGCVFFTDSGLQEYVAKCTHRAKPEERAGMMTYRKPHGRRR